MTTSGVYLRLTLALRYSAPRVAHIAAKLCGVFPGASANLVRALLVSSASVPNAAKERLEGIGPILRVCGYGRPNFDRSRFSDENRVVLYSEASLGHDNFHVYEIPIPAAFQEQRSPRTIEVTLAYDPPVRHSRFDYLGIKMSFRLIRGKILAEVVRAFQSHARKDGPRPDGLTSTKWDCPMKPSATVREGGTLQKAAFRMKQIPRAEFGNTYHLVVRCEKKWARPEHAPQNYSIVVVLRQEGAVNIYNQVMQRVRVAARARVR